MATNAKTKPNPKRTNRDRGHFSRAMVARDLITSRVELPMPVRDACHQALLRYIRG
jgi:hypothetical protein